MTTLLSALSSAKKVGTVVKTIKLMKDVTIEYYRKDDLEMTFCKGIDALTTLQDSVLVGDADFTEAEFVSLVNVRSGEKGTRASQAIKLSKKDFEHLLNNNSEDSDVI